MDIMLTAGINFGSVIWNPLYNTINIDDRNTKTIFHLIFPFAFPYMPLLSRLRRRLSNLKPRLRGAKRFRLSHTLWKIKDFPQFVQKSLWQINFAWAGKLQQKQSRTSHLHGENQFLTAFSHKDSVEKFSSYSIHRSLRLANLRPIRYIDLRFSLFVFIFNKNKIKVAKGWG